MHVAVRDAGFRLALALLLVAGLLVTAAPHVFAAPAAELDSARALIEEARPWVRQADDTDRSTADRKKGRREAYTRLKEARRLYDDYLDANPGETEALDAEYCECASMLYWVKKMASINEFDREAPVELPRSGPTPEPPPREDPEPAPPGEDVAAPAPPDPRDLMAERARETLANIEEIQAQHPGDVPRLHALYEKFLVEFDEPSLPEYTTAALRLGALADRMKTVFKEQVGSDPDAIDDTDSEEITQVVSKLAKLLRAKDIEDRQRGARLLGACGSGSAAIYLAKALRDRDDHVRELARDGLVSVGGTRVAQHLTKLYRDSKHDAQMGALDVLERIARKGEVDAHTVSPFLGRFVLSNDQKVAGRSLDFLAALGPPARDGLVEALDTRNSYKKMEVFQALAKARCYDTAPFIGAYLLQGDRPKTVALHRSAAEALRTMDTPAVPHMIVLLKDRRVRLGAAQVMREITGEGYSASDQKEWRAWCLAHGLELPA
jgi:hypothetical protein